MFQVVLMALNVIYALQVTCSRWSLDLDVLMTHFRFYFFVCLCRKLNSEIEQLRESLEETERRETECQLHLANAIRVAEKASIERATLASLAEREQKSANLALERSMREKWEMGRMEETLKVRRVLLI